MTKEELERIKVAYHSGLKVQIWFNGNWKNFDAREYSMYKDPFSENRQYRIVGSDYADMAEKRIEELEAQIEKMKCCGNCAKNGHICVAEEIQGKLCGKNKDKWELRR